MDIKFLVAGSLKSVENSAENNIKNNVNIMIDDELDDMLFKGIKSRDVFKEALTQFVLWRIQLYN